MADIDLIPQDYRTRLWLHSRVKRTATVMVSLVIIAACAFAGINYLGSRVDQKIGVLQQQQAISTQQRDLLTALSEEKKSLDHQLSLLGGLRSGASAPAMFVTIDRAMTEGEVWFQDWEFKRAGSITEEKPETVSNGYFIVIPASSDNKKEAWKIETHMTIRGQVRDHSALSRFVRRLFEQPEIQDIRILNTTLTGDSEFVNFNLAVTVNSSGASS